MKGKTCNSCSQTKPLEEFYRSKASKDGRTFKCKVCSKEYTAEYRRNNKESIALYRESYLPEYYEKTKEKRLARQKKYREENLEARRNYDKMYYNKKYKESKESFMERSTRRRAAKLQAVPPWVDKKHRDRLASIYKACRNVSKRTGKAHHVDHIIPLQGGNVCGLHVWWNLRIIPASMNLSKGNRLELLQE